MSRRARIEDILDLSVPSHPVLSADGRRIAYVVRSPDADADRTVDELWLVDTHRRLVRPYATTGGRTYSGTDLGLETMIMVTHRGNGAVKMEHRTVAGLCGQPSSVAEIAAHTQLPIGAARVVIADMIELDLVVICSTQPAGDAPSSDLMSRVLEGLRRL